MPIHLEVFSTASSGVGIHLEVFSTASPGVKVLLAALLAPEGVSSISNSCCWVGFLSGSLLGPSAGVSVHQQVLQLGSTSISRSISWGQRPSAGPSAGVNVHQQLLPLGSSSSVASWGGVLAPHHRPSVLRPSATPVAG